MKNDPLDLSNQFLNQAAQVISIQEKFNTQYVNDLQVIAQQFSPEANHLSILEAVFPKRMHVKHFEMEADFSLTQRTQKGLAIGVQILCIPIALEYELIYEENSTKHSRITIEVDQINFLNK